MDKDKRTCVGIIIVCVATLAVWVTAALLGYSIPRRELNGGSCVPQTYQGHLCNGVLANRTLCITPQKEYIVEIQVAEALSTWSSNGTQCYQNVKSSVCQFYFGPFEVEDAGSCGEWCDNVNYTQRWNEELQGCNGLDYNESVDELNCSESFYYSATSNLCKPTCEVDTGDNGGLIIVFAPIGIVGYVLAIVAACFNRTIMFKFPSLLLVYWCIVGLIYDSALLAKCCTHDDFFEYIEKPPVFCIILDFIAYYAGCLSIFFALFHTIILFSNVWFPIYAKRTFDLYRNRIHCGVVIFSVTVPWIGIGIIAVFSNIKDSIFYTFVPLYGCCGIVTALIGLVTWKLIVGNEKKFRSICSAECSPEAKLTAVLIFVAVFFVTAIIQFILNSYRTHEYLYAYFLCESTGTRSCQLQLNTFAYAINAFQAFGNALLCLAPYISLIYVTPVRIIKKCLNFSIKTRNSTQDISL